ncbi:hypothetical protein [Shewanella baltica]|uniref:hypothetical protein n=1 Tax=Shewanella baltica TaxID=62322 RepID=UPI000E1BA04E|nr:hypothetical protein [Shewanella baltica]
MIEVRIKNFLNDKPRHHGLPWKGRVSSKVVKAFKEDGNITELDKKYGRSTTAIIMLLESKYFLK